MKNIKLIVYLLFFFTPIIGCKDKAEESLSTTVNILMVYPNPNNGSIGIGVSNESEYDYQLNIFDPEGLKIFTNTISRKSVKNLNINVKANREGNGIFTVILQTSTTTITKKIIVL
ncbi:MAG: T9SS type A sorting domain-containing protein [Bacteroidota bacterium]|jgi:hypothetical protein